MTIAEKLGVNKFEAPLKVGPLTLAGRALLAPMAGVTDLAMRRIAERHGASASFSEMITAAGIARDDRETRLRLAGETGGSAPRVVQIAARDAVSIADAARHAEAVGAQWIDINMGCPCKRVTGGLAGSALMRDLDHAAALIGAAVAAVGVPVSVKMRLGWDDASRNAPELARRAEAEGAALVTVHGRTRAQFYTGVADWSGIGAVKRAVGIPVIANGDCESEADAANMLGLSGADGVMIGRAALGRPWFVGDVAHFITNDGRREQPSLAARGAIALEHFEALIESMGPNAGVRHARKHLAAYVDRAFTPTDADLAQLRRTLVTASEPQEVRGLIRRLFFEREQLVAA